jgi:hypothetical protein
VSLARRLKRLERADDRQHVRALAAQSQVLPGAAAWRAAEEAYQRALDGSSDSEENALKVAEAAYLANLEGEPSRSL